MSDGIFNVGKGRIAELANRVNSNDPTNSAFIVVMLKASGLEDDSVLKAYDTLAAILASTNDEATNTGYSRITLTSLTYTVDDDLDTASVDFADQLYPTVDSVGGAWGKVLVCYDPDTTAGTDTTVVPLSYHDFTIEPDGRDIALQVAAGGFFVVEDDDSV